MRFVCFKISRITSARLFSIVQKVNSRRLGKITAGAITKNEEQINQKCDRSND